MTVAEMEKRLVDLGELVYANRTPALQRKHGVTAEQVEAARAEYRDLHPRWLSAKAAR